MTDEKLKERERIMAIRDLPAPGASDLKERAIREGWSPDRTAREIVRRDAEARESRLRAREKDEEALDAPDPRAGGGPASDGGSEGAPSVVESARKAGIMKPDRPRIGRSSN